MQKGVVLLNMGGPNNLSEVEVFLKNMFNDKNIITVKSDLLRSFIAFMITTFRKKTAIENYKLLGGKSPIVENTERLIQALQKEFNDIIITYAMAYTPPFADEAIEKLLTCKEVLLIPLYPHYSTTTIKSSLEDFDLHVKKLNADFHTKTIKEFYENNLYNNLLIKLIKQTLNNDNPKEFDLIFSAHSLPQKIVNSGDPYEEQIKNHVKILENLLIKNKINFHKTHLAYQSKLGPVKWLEPELAQKLKELENKKVIIFPISFTIDNSETDFELSMEYKEEASDLGFKDYRVCKCPNYETDFVNFLTQMINENL